jgi:hypothetical protein
MLFGEDARSRTKKVRTGGPNKGLGSLTAAAPPKSKVGMGYLAPSGMKHARARFTPRNSRRSVKG